MVQLGCNYSPQLMQLLANGRARVDWIKLSRKDTVWTEIAICSPTYQMLLHTLPNASNKNFDNIDFDEINQQLEACKSPHAALHLLAAKEDWNKEKISDEEVLERMLNVVLKWKKEIGVDLLVENVPYYGFRGTLRCATDPAVIRTVCEEADIGLMLDLAHLRVAAFHRKEDAEQYLHALPLERVREIHVCGPAPDPEHGYLRDSHLEMQEVDYALLDKALSMTKPMAVTLEYGGTGPKFEFKSDIDALERQLARLNNILQNR